MADLQNGRQIERRVCLFPFRQQLDRLFLNFGRFVVQCRADGMQGSRKFCRSPFRRHGRSATGPSRVGSCPDRLKTRRHRFEESARHRAAPHAATQRASRAIPDHRPVSLLQELTVRGLAGGHFVVGRFEDRQKPQQADPHRRADVAPARRSTFRRSGGRGRSFRPRRLVEPPAANRRESPATDRRGWPCRPFLRRDLEGPSSFPERRRTRSCRPRRAARHPCQDIGVSDRVELLGAP